MQPLPLILDTDIGDDIDDALALALILNSPELELRGVTTVFRNAPRRAVLAQRVLRLWNRDDIPLAAGASKPLLTSLDELGAGLGAQFEVLDAGEDAPPFPHALDWIFQIIDLDEEPDADNLITITAIGPLTNIALFFARAPELAAYCHIVLMGGQWSAEQAEWNIRCDPEAAAMVFNSGAEISMIGLDVTKRCRLNEEQMNDLAAGSTPRAALLGRMLALWREETGKCITLHDPLAVMTLFSDCVQFEAKRIEVGLCGANRGKTLVAEGEPNARVAVDVDVERAIALFIDRVTL